VRERYRTAPALAAVAAGDDRAEHAGLLGRSWPA
jgi:hypothetical protein